ncbi:MAG TPA: hypothetical protein VJH22_04560 [Candidatus Nanoarchaeia archaeon]|nr:hypothetical protein [Candidatus Nanoarchaeia archaeon]
MNEQNPNATSFLLEPVRNTKDDVIARYSFDDGTVLDIKYGSNGSRLLNPHIRRIAIRQSERAAALDYADWVWEGGFGEEPDQKYILAALNHKPLREDIRQGLRTSVLKASVVKDPWRLDYRFASGASLGLVASASGLERVAVALDGRTASYNEPANDEPGKFQYQSMPEQEFWMYVQSAFQVGKGYRAAYDRIKEQHRTDDPKWKRWNMDWMDWMSRAWSMSLWLEDILPK